MSVCVRRVEVSRRWSCLGLMSDLNMGCAMEHDYEVGVNITARSVGCWTFIVLVSSTVISVCTHGNFIALPDADITLLAL